MAIYTCVLLDVDNTLLDFDAAERQALTDMLAEYELPHDARACEIYHAVNRELWDALAKGQLTKPKLFQQRFGRCVSIRSVQFFPGYGYGGIGPGSGGVQ